MSVWGYLEQVTGRQRRALFTDRYLALMCVSLIVSVSFLPSN